MNISNEDNTVMNRGQHAEEGDTEKLAWHWDYFFARCILPNLRNLSKRLGGSSELLVYLRVRVTKHDLPRRTGL